MFDFVQEFLFLLFFLETISIVKILDEKEPKKRVVVWWCKNVSLPHNFLQQNMNSGSAKVQIFLAAWGKFVMVKISDNGPDKK